VIPHTACHIGVGVALAGQAVAPLFSAGKIKTNYVTVMTNSWSGYNQLVWRCRPFHAARFLIIIGGARCKNSERRQ